MNSNKKTVIDAFFTRGKRNVTMGMEVEMYLYDYDNECLLEDEEVIKDILNNAPYKVTKDYYPYQLEIRTDAHNDPSSLFNDFVETLNKCIKICKRYNVGIYPLSWFGGGEMFNGVHFHFRNGNNTKFENSMFNMYPFVLSIMDAFKNSPNDINHLSYRISNSQHISIPNLRRFSASNRYSDICINRHTENSRHRMKSVHTIEMRAFDVPFNAEYLKNLIHVLYNLFKHIATGTKADFLYNSEELYTKYRETRIEIMSQRDSINKFFNLYNREIYEYLCEKFGIQKMPNRYTDKPFDCGSNIRRNKEHYSAKEFLGTYYNPSISAVDTMQTINAEAVSGAIPVTDYLETLENN